MILTDYCVKTEEEKEAILKEYKRIYLYWKCKEEQERQIKEMREKE